MPHDAKRTHHTDAQYSTPFGGKIFCFGKKSNITRWSRSVSLKVERHQLLKSQDHPAEKGVGQAARQCLTGAVHHEYNIRHLGQSGVAPPREGNDPVAILLGVPHIVQHRPGLAALADGEHHRGVLRPVRQMMGVAEEHIVVEMHVVEHHEPADGQTLGDICPHNVGEALSGGKQLGLAGAVQKAAEPGDQLIGVVVDKTFEIFRAAALIVRIELPAEIIVQLTVSVKAQSFAHLNDGRGGEKILAGDLLDAHALFAPFDVCGDAGDHLAFVLGK